MNLFDLSGKAALVTGGNGGIGLGMAKGLAQAGATVAIAGRDKAKNASAVKELGARALALEADLKDEKACRQVVDEAAKRLGRLDILVNNAGTNVRKRPEQYSLEEWKLVLDTNLTSAFIASQTAYPHMQRAGGGKIVNIGSMSADVREKDSSVYVGTKAGIQGFSEALRKEVNPLGVKVTLIEPGAVGTDMQSQYSPEEQRQKIEKMEMLRAEDIAACVLYTITQPKRCDVVSLQIRPHLQTI